MLTTHSPLFIDPTEDHTTIIRLDRTVAEPTPRTFRSDECGFTTDEKDNLKLALQFDPSVAEMFFGSFPIVVEGDTEVAAFQAVMDGSPDEYPVERRPVLIRARGKDTIRLLVKILGHFRVPFSTLHDTDSPRTSSGAQASSAWSANERIHSAIEAARRPMPDSEHELLRIVHRVSVPSFEAHHGIPTERDGAGKPWTAHAATCESDAVYSSVKAVLDELLVDTSRTDAFDGPFLARMRNAVEAWAVANAPGDPRYRFD
jgi:hypothetical protein